jgi:hypothetical protein
VPADYKYEFITLGRMKALQKAASEASDLYAIIAKSEVIAPSVVERFRVLRLLIARAALCPMDRADIELLEDLLGKDLGEEKR